MGGDYSVDEYPDYDELYCETCGDGDWVAGWYDTEEERQKLLENHCGY